MLELDTALPASIRGEHSPMGTPRDPQAWLRQWEQARWHDQPRYERPVTCGDATAVTSPAEVAASDTGPHSQTVESSADAAQLSRSAPMGSSAAKVAPGAMPLAAAIHDITASPLMLTLPHAVRATTPPAAKTSEPVANALSPHAGAKAAEWAARSLHVQLDADGAAVWIRDAKLSVQEALQLLEKLRPTLQRAGAGVATMRLTLNGQAVTQDATALTPITQPNLETPSWQPNRSD